MSRVGLSKIIIPDGVTITSEMDSISAKGSKGELSVKIHHSIDFSINENEIVFKPKKTDQRTKALWGTMRANIANIVKGVSTGFEIKLDIVGVGYRAQIQGNKVVLNLGFSHPVEMLIPNGIKVSSSKPTELILFGSDRQQLGQFAANIRSKRPPEPFKGKGVKYADEIILRKEGKKK